VLRRYLEAAPLAWALPRASEAFLLGSVERPGPLLDLGCGDGLFAELWGGLQRGVGLDVGPRTVARAARRRVYAVVIRADARRLPFAGGAFGTVVSVSTIEHIPDLDAVLAEVARVLRPGGRFAFSVPGPDFATTLFWPRALRALRCGPAARAYERLVNRLLAHRNLLPIEEWRERLARHGFTVRQVRPFKPPAAAALQDLAFPSSVPAAALRRLAGRWIVWRPARRVAAAALARLSVPTLAGTGRVGSNYFFYAEATTPGAGRATGRSPEREGLEGQREGTPAADRDV
jgi:SAM-dependent methyltransferase